MLYFTCDRSFRDRRPPPPLTNAVGAEVSGHFGTDFVVPKCLVAEVSAAPLYTPLDAVVCVVRRRRNDV